MTSCLLCNFLLFVAVRDIFPILSSCCLEYCFTSSVHCILQSKSQLSVSESYFSPSLSVSVALSFLLSPVSFQCRSSTCYPMSWLVQKTGGNGCSGFRVPRLHGAASSQIGSKCVGRGSSHHSAAQTPSTSDSTTKK